MLQQLGRCSYGINGLGPHRDGAAPEKKGTVLCLINESDDSVDSAPVSISQQHAKSEGWKRSLGDCHERFSALWTIQVFLVLFYFLSLSSVLMFAKVVCAFHLRTVFLEKRDQVGDIVMTFKMLWPALRIRNIVKYSPKPKEKQSGVAQLH